MKFHILISFALIFQSCTVFNQKEIKYTKNFPKCNSKIKIYQEHTSTIKFNGGIRYKCDRKYVCKNDQNEPEEALSKTLKEQMNKVKIKDSDIGSCFKFVDDKDKADYFLDTIVESNERGSIALAIISGLTLTLIPARAKYSMDFNYTLTNLKTKKSISGKSDYAFDLWIQFFLLPVLPFKSPHKLGIEYEKDFFTKVYFKILELEGKKPQSIM